MSESLFEKPILNSPYADPGRHLELDADGQPTDRIVEMRRRSDLVTPVPKSKKQGESQEQRAFVLGGEDAISTETHEYSATPIINEIRGYVKAWRRLPTLVNSSVFGCGLMKKINYPYKFFLYTFKRFKLDPNPAAKMPEKPLIRLLNYDATYLQHGT